MGCVNDRCRDPEDQPQSARRPPQDSTLNQNLLDKTEPEEKEAEVTTFDEEKPSSSREEKDVEALILPVEKKHLYYIDWIRVVAIHLVVVYHVVQALDWVNFFNHATGMKVFVIAFRATALQVGMPMFFHISGRAQALSPATGFKKTLARRAQRLLLPFAVCYVLLIPPWQFIDKEYDWQHPSSFHMKANPINWLFKYYTTSEFLLYFDMAWLWFLPALYVITLLSTPLILLAERYHGARMRYTYMLATVLLWVGLLLALVWGCNFSWRFGIFAILGPATAVLIAQVAPLPPRGGGDSEKPLRSWLAVRVFTLVQIASSVGIVLSFGYEEIDPPRADNGHDPRAAIPFMVLCLGFYIQGYFSQRWSQGCEMYDSGPLPWWVYLYRFCGIFVVQLVMMVSSPRGDVETGHFLYPIYSTTYKYGPQFGAVHVLGTWCYILIFVSIFQAYGEHIITKSFHKHATSSTVVVYIFHWIFIKVFAFWMLLPTLHRMHLEVTSVWLIAILSFVGLVFAVGCSLLVYSFLLCCPPLGRLFGL